MCKPILMFMQRQFQDFNISEIIKAGSLGQGTAVPGKYDIDLVIYSRSKCNAILFTHQCMSTESIFHFALFYQVWLD